jgi:hypothetical protein
MKKILLIASVILAFSFSRLSAQIPNNSFENWQVKTIYFAGFPPTVPPDTFPSNEPDLWTTSNSISGADSLGGIFFVSQSSDAYAGTSAIQMKTDSIVHIPFINKITLPGFAINGIFPITAATLTGSGSVLSPGAVIGAGQPFTQRLGKIKGYYKYTPVYNPNTSSNDTCLVWATLRKGNIVVADAIFKSTDSATTYTPFEASFVYRTCDMPDTLVILMASSVPNVQTLLGGSSGLVPGSVLLVDSIYYENLPGGFNFAPIARPDLDSTNKNVAKTVNVKANDEDCDNSTPSLTVSVLTQPTHGTTSVTAGNVLYTPTTNYYGVDSFTYTLSDGNSSSTAKVTMYVFNTLGINEAPQIPVFVYPVPATDVLNVQFENTGKSTIRVYDVTGNLVLSSVLAKNNNALDIHELANGIYGVQISDENNAVIARSKFTVNR